METGFRQALNSSSLPTTSVRRTDSPTSQNERRVAADQEKIDAARNEAEGRRAEDRIVRELAHRDREVRAHEEAHVAVGGQYVISGPNYTYQQGPNGRNYAIGGEVSLDVSEEEKPNDTLNKAEVVRRAALAPVEPSAQDRLVAARATQLAAQARVAIAAEQRELQQSQQSTRELSPVAREFTSSDQIESERVNVYA